MGRRAVSFDIPGKAEPNSYLVLNFQFGTRFEELYYTGYVPSFIIKYMNISSFISNYVINNINHRIYKSISVRIPIKFRNTVYNASSINDIKPARGNRRYDSAYFDNGLFIMDSCMFYNDTLLAGKFHKITIVIDKDLRSIYKPDASFGEVFLLCEGYEKFIKNRFFSAYYKQMRLNSVIELTNSRSVILNSSIFSKKPVFDRPKLVPFINDSLDNNSSISLPLKINSEFEIVAMNEVMMDVDSLLLKSDKGEFVKDVITGKRKKVKNYVNRFDNENYDICEEAEEFAYSHLESEFIISDVNK